MKYSIEDFFSKFLQFPVDLVIYRRNPSWETSFLCTAASGNKILKKTSQNEVNQDLVSSRCVKKGIADHIGLVVNQVP